MVAIFSLTTSKSKRLLPDESRVNNKIANKHIPSHYLRLSIPLAPENVPKEFILYWLFDCGKALNYNTKLKSYWARDRGRERRTAIE